MTHTAPGFRDAYWREWEAHSLACAVAEIERCRRAFFNAGLHRYSLGASQLPVLAHLWAGHDGVVQHEIATTLRLDEATVTRVVQHLEDVGLALRRTDVGDARVRRVWLTPAGQDLAPVVETVAREWNALVGDGWDMERCSAVLLTLHEMRDRVRDSLAIDRTHD